MEIRHAVSAATFAGLAVVGAVLTGADATPDEINVDGVAISVLESADYMPPPAP